MRKPTITTILVLLAVLASSFAGATVGKLIPGVDQLLGVKDVGAESLSVEAAPLTPAGTGFTYQGRLKSGGSPANGQYEFQFALYDAPAGPNLIAGPIPQLNQTVSDGLFTVVLDFGAAAFNGDTRYLEISVRLAGGGGYTGLGPRQLISPAPYALYALKTKGYKNVVTVSPDGGDYTSVQAALNSITTNSATNKYLVWVGPGRYTERVTMKQWVDIEGAGEKLTTVTFTGSPSNNLATVAGASNAELRSLTVENTGNDTFAIAIINSGASPSLLHVTATSTDGFATTFGIFNTDFSSPTMTSMTVKASGSTSDNYGVVNVQSSPIMNDMTAWGTGSGNLSYGVYNIVSSPSMTNMTAISTDSLNSRAVYNDGSSPIMTNVIATANGSSSIAVYNTNSSPIMNNLTATSAPGFISYGVYNEGSGVPTINNAVITGVNSTVLNNGSSGSTKVGGSKLQGGPVSGPITCAGVYDENYTFFANTCP